MRLETIFVKERPEEVTNRKSKTALEMREMTTTSSSLGEREILPSSGSRHSTPAGIRLDRRSHSTSLSVTLEPSQAPREEPSGPSSLSLGAAEGLGSSGAFSLPAADRVEASVSSILELVAAAVLVLGKI